MFYFYKNEEGVSVKQRVDFTINYNYYNPNVPHRNQIQHEKRTKALVPPMFVGATSFDVPNHTKFPVCIPKRFGKDNSEYGGIFYLSKAEIKEKASGKINPFMNVNYIPSTNAIRISDVDANKRYTENLYVVYNQLFRLLEGEGFDISRIGYIESQQDIFIEDIIANQYRYITSLLCTFYYKGRNIKCIISLNLDGTLHLVCDVDERTPDGRHYNVFKGETSDYVGVDISDGCASYAIARKIFLEWMLIIRDEFEKLDRISRKEYDEIKKPIQSVNSSNEVHKTKIDTPIPFEEGRRNLTNVERGIRDSYLEKYKGMGEIIEVIGESLLAYALRDSRKDFYFEITPFYTANKNKNGRFLESNITRVRVRTNYENPKSRRSVNAMIYCEDDSDICYLAYKNKKASKKEYLSIYNLMDDLMRVIEKCDNLDED